MASSPASPSSSLLHTLFDSTGRVTAGPLDFEYLHLASVDVAALAITPSGARWSSGGVGVYGRIRAVTLMATTPSAGRLAGVLVVLTGAAVVVSRVGGLGVEREHAVAAVRAIVQLAAVSAVIAVVLRSVIWSMGFVVLMFVVATLTSARRLGLPVSTAPWVGAAVGSGAVPVVVLCLGSGVVPLNGAGLLPVAGIIIGGVMTVATLTGRRAFQELRAGRDLRSSPGSRSLVVASDPPGPRAAAREALVPGIDQTRTVGLVTLPGAFIGVLLGGGTATEAGAAQVLVFIGLLAARASTAAVMLHLVAGRRVLREDLRTLPR